MLISTAHINSMECDLLAFAGTLLTTMYLIKGKKAHERQFEVFSFISRMLLMHGDEIYEKNPLEPS